MPPPKITVLSRFFDENTRLVSGMCSKCHGENTDARIVAVNRRFLLQVEQRKKASRGFEDMVTCGHQSQLESENKNDACVVCFRPSNKLFACEKADKQNTSEHQTDNRKETCIINDDEDNYGIPEMKHVENKTEIIFSLRASKDNGIEKTNEEAAMKNETKENVLQRSSKSALIKEDTSIASQSAEKKEIKVIKTECDLHLSPTSQINKSPELYSKYFDGNFHKASTLEEADKKIKVETKEETFLNFVPVWHPPKSPHNLIEENLYADPWALLVATIFLNKTSCATARPYIEWFLSDFHNPFDVLKHDPTDLEKYFTAIGLKKRAQQVWRMSHDFVHKEWKDVKELHGIGSYGRDAFNMFCLGRMHIEPKDRFLRIYKAWFDLLEKDKKDVCLTEETNEDESEDSGFGCSPQDGDVTNHQ